MSLLKSYFPKSTLGYNSFHFFFYKLNQPILLVYICNESLLLCCFFSNFRYNFLYISFLFFFVVVVVVVVVDNIANFFPNFAKFIKKSLIKKYIHLVLSESLLYVLILGDNIPKGFFSIFVTNEIFKTLFTKRKLIRYYYIYRS